MSCEIKCLIQQPVGSDCKIFRVILFKGICVLVSDCKDVSPIIFLLPQAGLITTEESLWLMEMRDNPLGLGKKLAAQRPYWKPGDSPQDIWCLWEGNEFWNTCVNICRGIKYSKQKYFKFNCSCSVSWKHQLVFLLLYFYPVWFQGLE